jgi:hypothetical protein
MSPETLRELLRNLQHWRGLFEDEGTSTLTAPDGEVFCLQDLQDLYDHRHALPSLQAQAVELCLYHDMLDEHVAPVLEIPPEALLIYLAEAVRTMCALYHELYAPDISSSPALNFLDAGPSLNFLDLGAKYGSIGEIAPPEWDLPGPGGGSGFDYRAVAEGDDTLQVL